MSVRVFKAWRAALAFSLAICTRMVVVAQSPQVTLGTTVVSGRSQNFGGIGVDFFGGTLSRRAAACSPLTCASPLRYPLRRASRRSAAFRASGACLGYQCVFFRCDAVRTGMCAAQCELECLSSMTLMLRRSFFTERCDGSFRRRLPHAECISTKWNHRLLCPPSNGVDLRRRVPRWSNFDL